MEIAQFAAHAVALLRDVSLRSLVIFALAALICLGLRRASAAVRHALWSVTLISLLCLPILCAILPRWEAPVLPVPSPQVSRVRPSTQPLSERPSRAAALAPSVDTKEMSAASEASAPNILLPPVTQVSPARTPPQVIVPAPPPELKSGVPTAKPTAAMWLFGIWLAGMMAALARILAGLAVAWRLVRRSRLVTVGPLMEAAEDARRSLTLARPVSLREGASDAPIFVPMTFGVIRPVVLLPEGASEWPHERLRVVLLHEMAHVGRRDWLTTMIGQAACVLYWFHPLAWLALRCLRVEGEQACDDLVLNSGVTAPDYAAHLLDIVRGLTVKRGTLPAVVTMAQPREVVGRLKTILADGQNRRGVGRRGLILTALTAACLLAPLATLRPVASAKAENVGRPGQGKQMSMLPAPQSLGVMMSSSNRLAALMAGKSRWEKRWPDGVRVRLLFVGAQDAQYNIISSWTPDGKLLQAGNAAMRQPSIYGRRYYQFVYGISFPSAKLQNTAYISYSKAGETAGVSGDAPPWGRGEPNWGNFPASFPKGQAKETVLVNVGTGPETTLIAASPRVTATRRLPTGERVTLTKAFVTVLSALSGPMKTTEVGVSLPSRFVRDISQYRLFAVGRDGRPIRVQHAGWPNPDTSKKTVHIVFTFRTAELPLDGVKEFRFTSRPTRTAIFQDVSLRPNPQPTAPDPGAADTGSTARPAALTTSPSAASSAFRAGATPTASPWVVTLPDGTQVRLVAVEGRDSKKRVVASWKPDGSPVEEKDSAPVSGSLTTRPGSFTYPEDAEVPPGTLLSLRLTTTPSKQYHIAVVGISAFRRGYRDINLALSAGPYTTLVSGSLAHGASQSLPTGEVVTLSHGVTRWRNSPLAGYGRRKLTRITLTLPVRFTTSDYDTKLEALGPDGRPLVFLTYRTAPGGRGLWNYDFSPAELQRRHVSGFRFISRPATHFTFHDVALQPNPPAGAASPHAPLPISQTFDPLDNDPAVRERARQQRIETALTLRGRLEGWARRNAALLRAMRAASPDDLAALLRVYNHVPPATSYLLFNNVPDTAPFGGLLAPPTLSHLRRSQEPIDVRHREDFTRYRDLRLSQSVNTGPMCITLWASGRVTETALNGWLAPKETANIAPAYPFLH